MIRIAILGSTGSIGESALSVVEAHPGRVTVVALAAGNNTARLAEQVRKHRPALASVATPENSPTCADSSCRASAPARSSAARRG